MNTSRRVPQGLIRGSCPHLVGPLPEHALPRPVAADADHQPASSNADSSRSRLGAGRAVAGSEGPGAWFALLPGAVLVCLLIVSTTHVYEAKRPLGWSGWQAWSFAVGLDCAIFVSELPAVWCGDAFGEAWWKPKVVIVASVGYSASLNSYVNLLHAGWSRVTDPRKR